MYRSPTKTVIPKDKSGNGVAYICHPELRNGIEPWASKGKRVIRRTVRRSDV